MILCDKFHLWKTVQTHLLYFRELQLSPNQTRWKLIAVRQPPVIVYISLSAAFTIICQHTFSACNSDAYFSGKSTLNNRGSSIKLICFPGNSIKNMTCGFFWVIIIVKTNSMHLLFMRVYQKTIMFWCGCLM